MRDPVLGAVIHCESLCCIREVQYRSKSRNKVSVGDIVGHANPGLQDIHKAILALQRQVCFLK